MTDATFAEAEKPKKDRSPSFPFIPLERAIERASAFATDFRRTPTRPESAAKTWGYKPKSSGLQQTIAALKSYGLMEDIGRGDARKIQLTDLAWRLLYDTRPGVRERAIREAALRPKLIGEYVMHWFPHRPANHHCLSELTMDRGFTEDAARTFLKVFDETTRFANLRSSDKLEAGEGGLAEEDSDSGEESKPHQVEVGDLVQWVSQEALQFRAPKRVTDIRSDPQHGTFIFVEGYTGGLPVEQIEIVQKHTAPPQQPSEQASPAARNAGPRPLVERATFPLDEGLAAIEIPESLTEDSYELLEGWLQLVLRKAKRSIRQPGSD